MGNNSMTKSGLKIFCAVQLIVENAKDAQTEYTPVKMRLILNKLKHDCSALNKDFWKHLDSNAEEVFQDKLRRIEKIIDE